jgi:phosphatidyl-myo-inositol dimannoside synthase
MKTLLFTIEYPPFKGGVANYYGNMVDHWPKKDEISVLSNNNGELLSDKTLPKWLPAIKALYEKVKKERIEHILVGQVLPLGTVCLIMKALTKVNYSIFIHGMDVSLSAAKFRKKFIAKLIFAKAEKIICASYNTAELFNELYEDEFSEKIKVVHPGVRLNDLLNIEQKKDKLENIKEELGLNDKIVLFSLGRLVHRKGFDIVMDAMPQVLEKVPNLIYLVAGGGPDEEILKKKAEKLPNVKFLGIIDEEKKWLLLELCDIFITIPRYEKNDFEGFGIVFLEAALAGKPVIAGNSGGVDEAVEDEETGLLVDPVNTDDVAEKIILLSINPQLRHDLGVNGLRRASEEFNWTNQAKKIYLTIN